MLIPVGTEVRIKPNSEHYGTNSRNPKDLSGVVVDNKRTPYTIDSGYVYVVKWSNGKDNHYRYRDLIEVCPFEGNV